MRLSGLITAKTTGKYTGAGRLIFRGVARTTYTGVNFQYVSSGRVALGGLVPAIYTDEPPVCDGLPISTATADPTCPDGYWCPSDANPPEYSCVKKRYVLAPGHIKYGIIRRGASGAYVPAITVCQSRLDPIRLGHIRRYKDGTPVALPESQIVNNS